MPGPQEPFVGRAEGGVDVRLSDAEREVLANVASEMQTMLVTDAGARNEGLKRLFPPAHANDPDLEAEYRDMVHDDLLRKKLDDLEVLEQTAHATELSANEVDQWMQSINGLRLVLGTRLDVTEDSQRPSEDDPTAGQYALYEYLGYLIESLIRGQHLPND